MTDSSNAWFGPILAAVLDRRELTSSQIEQVFDAMLQGGFGEPETAAFLIAMRMKGESPRELAAAATMLRRHMTPFDAGSGLLDTCGTGGDDAGTFNISTAAAIVAAGAGARVVKHGNRAVSSRSGSADVLAELGLPIDAGIEWARRCLDRAGLAFLFAPQFHPAMRHVGPLRRRLGVRTMLNLLGPLANPAGAEFQVLGVGRRDLLDPVAGALAALGTCRAFVVSGRDGLDEVSLSAPTDYREVREGSVTIGEWMPTDFGLDACLPMDLKAAGPAESAQIIREVRAGRAIPARRVVVANAAVGLLAAGRVRDVRAGARAAETAIDSGMAGKVLESLRACAP